jgi:hypothetical protein
MLIPLKLSFDFIFFLFTFLFWNIFALNDCFKHFECLFTFFTVGADELMRVNFAFSIYVEGIILALSEQMLHFDTFLAP